MRLTEGSVVITPSLLTPSTSPASPLSPTPIPFCDNAECVGVRGEEERRGREGV